MIVRAFLSRVALSFVKTSSLEIGFSNKVENIKNDVFCCRAHRALHGIGAYMGTGILCGAKNARCLSSAALMTFVIEAPLVRTVAIGMVNDAALNWANAFCLKDNASPVPDLVNSGDIISSP